MIKWWFRYRQKCNADLKRNFYLMSCHDVVNDGISEGSVSLFDVLYPLFIISGIVFFLSTYRFWLRLIDKIKGKDEG